MTYGDLLDRLIELGIAPPDRRRELADVLDEEVEDPTWAFAELGVAAHVEDAREKRDVPMSYWNMIQATAALSDGAVVVSDVVFDSDDELRFRINGRPATWWIDEFYSFSAVWGQVHKLAPGGDDPRRIYDLESTDPEGGGSAYLLLTPAQAEALRTEFGFALDTVPPD